MSTTGPPFHARAARPRARRARVRVRFPGAPFGPMALRRLARERFEPGECFVGWTLARVDPSPWAQALVAIVSLLPGAGVIVAAELARARLLVLSDRRLWLIDPRARHPLAPDELAAGELSLDRTTFELIGSARNAQSIDHFEQHPFRANLREGSRVRGLRFTIAKRGAPRRLPEAFRLLARPREESAGYAGDGA